MERNKQEARNLGMLCHLSTLVWIPLVFIGLPIPFSNLVGPLVIWWTKRHEYRFVDIHGKESLNFQISISLYGMVVLLVLTIVLLAFLSLIGVVNRLGGVLGFWLWRLAWIVGLMQLCLVAIAALKANYGKVHRYPLTIRFLR